MSKDSKAACMGAALSEDRVHFLAPGMRTLHTLIAQPVILMNGFCFSKFNVQEQNGTGRQIQPRDYRGR